MRPAVSGLGWTFGQVANRVFVLATARNDYYHQQD
jgi:hypothetical protein